MAPFRGVESLTVTRKVVNLGIVHRKPGKLHLQMCKGRVRGLLGKQNLCIPASDALMISQSVRKQSVAQNS